MLTAAGCFFTRPACWIGSHSTSSTRSATCSSCAAGCRPRPRCAKVLGIPGFENADRVNWSYPVPYPVVQQVTEISNLPWDIEDRDAANRDVWGLYTRFNRVSELGQKPVHLIYLHGNPVIAYENLFLKQQTAPKFICLKYCALFPLDAWNAFTALDGPLLTAIRSSTHRPLYLLRDISAPPVI
jgi:hypothetical protein